LLRRFALCNDKKFLKAGWVGDFRIHLQVQRDEVPKQEQFQGAFGLGIANPTNSSDVIARFALANRSNLYQKMRLLRRFASRNDNEKN
jgi:hypothetical protein